MKAARGCHHPTPAEHRRTAEDIERACNFRLKREDLVAAVAIVLSLVLAALLWLPRLFS